VGRRGLGGAAGAGERGGGARSAREEGEAAGHGKLESRRASEVRVMEEGRERKPWRARGGSYRDLVGCEAGVGRTGVGRARPRFPEAPSEPPPILGRAGVEATTSERVPVGAGWLGAQRWAGVSCQPARCGSPSMAFLESEPADGGLPGMGGELWRRGGRQADGPSCAGVNK